MLKKISLLMSLLLLLSMTGCREKGNQTIVIAEQFGLAYAPIVIMREMNFLEEAVGDAYTVEWKKLANTAAIREAMLAEDLDVGFMGIPPFLIGVDQDMGWKMISGLSSSPLGLITNDPSIKSLEDLEGKGKIALPQPGSIQHILLSMAAERSFGDATYLDQQLISMKHPDGLVALNEGSDVVAHFTSPPYLFEEMDTNGFYHILSGEEAFGGAFTFIVSACRQGFYEDQEAYDAFLLALDRSIAFMNNNREDAIKILSDAYTIPEEVVEDYLYDRQMVFSKDINGVGEFIGFMYDAGYLQKTLLTDEVLW